jgi:glycerol kinase
MLDIKVQRPVVLEATALGAAYFTGIAAGIWKYPEDILRIHRLDREFTPQMTADKRGNLYTGWKKAVGRSQHWA